MDYIKIDLPVLGSAATPLLKCYKLPHPVNNNRTGYIWVVLIKGALFIDSETVRPTIKSLNFEVFNWIQLSKASQKLAASCPRH